jgi:aryl carrier-like protein
MKPTDVQERVRAAFARHAPASRIVNDDVNFFEAGLNSTALATILPDLRALGAELSLVDLYRFPTVRVLTAELIRRASARTGTSAATRTEGQPVPPWARTG